MQKQPLPRPQAKIRLEYRHYDLPVDFPVIALLENRFTFPEEHLDKVTFMHLHNCIEFGYCWSGAGILRVEHTETDYGAGDITIIPPYATHITYRDTKRGQTAAVVAEYLYVDPARLLQDCLPAAHPLIELFQHNFEGFPYVLHGQAQPGVERLLLNILDVMRQGEEYYQEEVRGLAMALMAELARLVPGRAQQAASPLQNDPVLALTPCVQYISENYMQHIPPQTMADLCHMSVTHFRRVFKNTMGSSPLEYIHHVRVQKAKELLYQTEDSVLDVSLAVGYDSISSFNRRFVDIAGTTPTKWRNGARAIQKKDLHFSRFQMG